MIDWLIEFIFFVAAAVNDIRKSTGIWLSCIAKSQSGPFFTWNSVRQVIYRVESVASKPHRPLGSDAGTTRTLHLVPLVPHIILLAELVHRVRARLHHRHRAAVSLLARVLIAVLGVVV